MPPSDSLALVEFIRRALSRLDVRIANLSRLYERTETQIVANILTDLTAQKTVSLRTRRSRIAEVQRMLRILDDSARTQVPDLLEHAAEVARRVGAEALGEKPAPLSVTNKQAVTLLTENLIEDLGNATRTVGRRVEDIFRQEALHKAQAAILQETPDKVASQALQQALQKRGVTAFYDRRGRKWTLTNYADMATQTVAQEAVNSVQVQLLSERGVDIVQINHSAKCCEECLEFDDKTFSLTGRAQGFPVLKKYPPYHGRCHHVVFASPLAFEERRASGWVPASPTERALVGA